MVLSDLFAWLEDTSLAAFIRQSMWLYPILEIIHIIGITVLVGAALMFDLSLLGSAKQLRLSGLAQHLLPWSQRGLVLILPSGILLFITNSKTLGVDPTFWLKMILLLIAAINVLVFHRLIFRKGNFSNPDIDPVPVSAKISAVISIAVWLGIIACGRLLAY